VLLPLIIFFVILLVHIDRSLPKYTGEVLVDGITSPVNIRFDLYGTPTLIAESDKDAYFAQGYLHASERMWQMDIQRRLTQGRTSEVFGRNSVNTDIWMRTLGINEAAKKSWRGLSEDAKGALTAYTKGVNAWLKSSQALPLEYLYLGIEPEPWKENDSIAWQKMLALKLGHNMFGELRRLKALSIISHEQYETFFPIDPKIKMSTNSNIAETNNTNSNALERKSIFPNKKNETRRKSKHSKPGFQQDIADVWFLGDRFAGSNAWVVSGKHTKSKYPILSNDPHLNLSQNSLWYSLQMKAKRLDVSGMSIVGVPGITLGRNKNIAWGATSLMSDQQDLFVLDIPLDDNTSYETDLGRKKIYYEEETIRIRADFPEALNKRIKPITVRIRRTEIGPIISDVIQTSGETMALRWSALDDNDLSFEAFFKLQYADNWEEFRTAVQFLKAPGLNFLYADNYGNIGSQAGGHFPVRGKGTGVLPQESFISKNLWRDYVSFDKLPKIFNPQSGIIVSANNEIDTNHDIVISNNWASEARYKRINQQIRELISNKKNITVDDMLTIQQDIVDLNTLAFLKTLQNKMLFQAIREKAPVELRKIISESLSELLTWKAEYAVDSVGASIYYYWIKEFKKAVFSNQIDKKLFISTNSQDISSRLADLVSEEYLQKLLLEKENVWCTRKSSEIYSCQSELIDSFYTAIRELKDDTRSLDLLDWKWGDLHSTKYTHDLLSSDNLIGKLFTKIIPVGGSPNTINVSNAIEKNTGGFEQSLGASFRQSFDMGADAKECNILPTGQSSHFTSRHYRDQMKVYYNNLINCHVKLNQDRTSIITDVESGDSIALIPERN
jgi:penicillin amidase